MSVTTLLGLKSSEATLICDRGHIAGHPHFCPAGCVFHTAPPPGVGLVQHVVRLRVAQHRARDVQQWDGQAAPLTVPLLVENGWLIDGHHRVAIAVMTAVPELPVQVIAGNLIDIQAHHAYVRELATRPGAVPPGHRRTPTA